MSDIQLPDVLNDGAFTQSVVRDSTGSRGPLKTTRSQSTTPQLALTTYSLSDALQGMALYKPQGVAYDAFNNQLGNELGDLGTEPLFKNRDNKLAPYDVFLADPDPSKMASIGTNAAGGTPPGGPNTDVVGQNGQGEVIGGDPTAMGMVFPLEGGVSKHSVSQPWRQGGHPGVDIVGQHGQKIVAAKAGKAHIETEPQSGGFGNAIWLDHGDRLWTTYGHCSQQLVTEGQEVQQGEVIGLVGNTGYSQGAHLHFEVHVNTQGVPQWAGRPRSSGDGNVNPMPYIGL